MPFARPTAAQLKRQRTARRRKNMLGLMTPSRALAKGTYAGATSEVTVEKHDYIRSPALMKAYRAIPCQNCGKSDGTVCGAHSNWHAHGKGKSIKADDNRCASLCFTCHGVLDQGSVLGASERAAMWWTAHVKTVTELLARDLWPRRVPVPNLEWQR